MIPLGLRVVFSPEDMHVKSKPPEAPSENRGAREDTSDRPGLDRHFAPSRKRIAEIYGFAVMLALVLFFFQLVMIFDVAGELLRSQSWLGDTLGAKNAGKLIVLMCFFALMAVHASQATLWGVFLHRTRLLKSVTEGVYFSAASVTTLGYGDILLTYPWRHIGTLIAITGVLMFGCSTAFLFLVLQSVWQHS